MMQSAASRRALSFLASKVHRDPLPLSPRESAQLLNLLTTSFRTNLDLAHPARPVKSAALSETPVSRPTAASSQSSASEHVESILTNPLFARRPLRRGSDATKRQAEAMLKDPLSWFLDQAALGAADLGKAAACLQVLQTKALSASSIKPATEIAKWLQASGLDRSREFICGDPKEILRPLAAMLTEESQAEILWQWLAYSPAKRFEETGLAPAKIQLFRANLLRAMVNIQKDGQPCIDDAVSTFVTACKMQAISHYAVDSKVLRLAGFSIVNQILSETKPAHSLESHEAFQGTVHKWAGKWSRGFAAMLSLHHPTDPSAKSAIAYIRDPEGLARNLQNATSAKRTFLVKLCLQAARQSLAEEVFPDTQFILQFAQETFPDLLQDHHQKSVEQKREEDRNIELLDGLLPA